MNKAKELLESLFRELKLKDQYFQTVDSLSDEELIAFGSVLNRIDDTFNPMVLVDTSKPVKIAIKLQHFMTSHCRERHYMFSIKKCGKNDCCCGTVRTEADIFLNIHHLPDPAPMTFEPEKFKPFNDCYGRNVDIEADKFLPSKSQKLKEHGMPFSPTQQALNCTKMVIQCYECLKWRCIYAAKNISKEEKSASSRLIENLLSCGASFQDIEVDNSDEEESVLDKLLQQKVVLFKPYGSTILVSLGKTSHCAIIVDLPTTYWSWMTRFTSLCVQFVISQRRKK